ncbi:hypothetical protein ANCDUO_15918 [Ancylostoma duodenale]|uniref:Uncharacterized protein n=1 Tax=Ancylostoma duodenale TaxID=51022 RepID=A0A0C2G4X0_9BILA|nr:hypothetical protein ANCDUO_15918 [Ancylostoma duodenale]
MWINDTVTIFVAYAPTSSYDDEEVEALYMDFEKFYREEHTFYKEDAVVDNIDEEYDRLVQHLRDSARKVEGSRSTKRRLSYETLELIRQRGVARAARNYQLTSEQNGAEKR